MSSLKPWTFGPFELLLHGDMHLRDGADMDRRIAMISFDNAIEVTISTYLQLHPKQRNNRQYSQTDCTRWLKNYHTKLDFLEAELKVRKCAAEVDHDEIIWFHKVRNEQYHGGTAGIPEEHNVRGIRRAAIWTFSFLFEIEDVDGLIDEEIENRSAGGLEYVDADPIVDDYLDGVCEPLEILGSKYTVGDVLRSVDPIAYEALRADITADGDNS